MTAAVSTAVSIPVIASGGAGTFEHFLDVFTSGRGDAALAASIFHFAEHSVAGLKKFLHTHGVPVRLTESRAPRPGPQVPSPESRPPTGDRRN
jgi:cyclase